MATYGIDLGTTYSCVAVVDDTGEPVVITNSIGEESTPSVVYFESPYKVVVGHEAKNAALRSPELVVSRVKREMGRPGVELDFHGTSYTPEMVSAFILRDLAKSVEDGRNDTVENVVITVPAYFGLVERNATQVAGEMAGLKVLSVVPEPVAAALHYGMLNDADDRTILVFDLGGGTFDTTVIRLAGREVTVICTDGDHNLGGADLDDRVAGYLCEQFSAEHPDAAAGDSEDFLQDAAMAAEDLKKRLTTRLSRRQPMVFGGRRAAIELTRHTFENITADLLDRTMQITERTLATSRTHGARQIDEVLLVGGSTRMPAVAQALRSRFGFEPKIHEPDLAVAKGAALFALVETLRLNQLDGSSTSLGESSPGGEASSTVARMAEKKVTIVVPRAFGVAVIDRQDESDDAPEPPGPDTRFVVQHLLSANTPLPAERTERFFTAYPDQTEITVEIWEQEGAIASAEPEHNKHIGSATIQRLPPRPAHSPVDVTFAMNESGRLHVVAQELESGGTGTVEITIGDVTPQQVASASDAIARLS